MLSNYWWISENYGIKVEQLESFLSMPYRLPVKFKKYIRETVLSRPDYFQGATDRLFK